jgi:hypothetical protein
MARFVLRIGAGLRYEVCDGDGCGIYKFGIGGARAGQRRFRLDDILLDGDG